MARLPRGWPIALARVLIAGIALLAACSVIVAILESRLGVPNASAAYLLAVVTMAVGFGTPAAVGTAVAAFLLYDLLFVQPTGVLAVADPEELLNLLLLLVLGVVVGQLAGLQRARAEAAVMRERQARAQYRIGRALADGPAGRALDEVVAILAAEEVADRAWIVLDREPPPVDAPPVGATHQVMRRSSADDRIEWIRVHDRRFATAVPPAPADEAFRIPVEVAREDIGSIWVARARSAGPPGRGDSRVLAATADLIGQALRRDRLAAEATATEVVRRSDAAKSALLDSVSHDLRTPLATIRAAAGILRDRDLELAADVVRERADVIDREAERLNGLVTNLLDMSRLEAGGLRAQLEPFPLEDVVDATVVRLRPVLGPRPVTIVMPADLPPVLVDPVFIDQVLTNLLENVARHTPPTTRIRIRATAEDGAGVLLAIEDDGPGVPPDALPTLFDKFTRVAVPGEGARRGSGLGLAVVRGLVEAMDGRVAAGPSPLGGLDIVVHLRAAAGPRAGLPTEVAP